MQAKKYISIGMDYFLVRRFRAEESLARLGADFCISQKASLIILRPFKLWAESVTLDEIYFCRSLDHDVGKISNMMEWTMYHSIQCFSLF